MSKMSADSTTGNEPDEDDDILTLIQEINVHRHQVNLIHQEIRENYSILKGLSEDVTLPAAFRSKIRQEMVIVALRFRDTNMRFQEITDIFFSLVGPMQSNEVTSTQD